MFCLDLFREVVRRGAALPSTSQPVPFDQTGVEHPASQQYDRFEPIAFPLAGDDLLPQFRGRRPSCHNDSKITYLLPYINQKNGTSEKNFLARS